MERLFCIVIVLPLIRIEYHLTVRHVPLDAVQLETKIRIGQGQYEGYACTSCVTYRVHRFFLMYTVCRS